MIVSYRPTISIYFNRHIADIGYYRNWDNKDLFYEAIAITSLYGECESIEEYREKKYGCQKAYHVIKPEIIEGTDENLTELERYSEFPIIVDITAKCIYSNYGALNWRELACLPSILDAHKTYGFQEVFCKVENYDELISEKDKIWESNENWQEIFEWERKHPLYEFVDKPVKFDRISKFTDFGLMMSKCRIPFGYLNLDEIRRILLDWEEAKYHLSQNVMEHLKKCNS